ncbi:magnesium transporter [Qiania dongpingensis]|uniref:Magnesium transporter MgtE n=1 Tax=Qiania dongpingensis TaxID=2763669 RepID=A0A7G9G830_9FIRM|nr:magnesium transporter [Qiania dongpingensis]QNM06962.1 magnesium transporter [Qiania dongpingensis]
MSGTDERLKKDELLELLLHADEKTLKEQIEYIHPADILELLHDEDIDPKALMARLPDSLIADIIDEEDEEDKYGILKLFSEDKQEEILEEMSSDELADMVGSIEDRSELAKVIGKLSEEDRSEVRQLLSYPPDTAGGIMATEFINIYDNKTVYKTLLYLQEIAEEVETAYCLYVVDRQNHLRGSLNLTDLVTSSFDTAVLDIMNPHVITAHVEDDQEEISRQFEKYGLVELPVVNDADQLVGVITVDDVMEIATEEATEDIHYMGGISGEEEVDGPLSDSLKSRLPWLVVNLLTAFLASWVVSLFEATISKVVALSAIMSIITGMGGNAGTQSMTIIVRGIALNELNRDNALRIFLKEFTVGIVTGAAIGGIVAAVEVVIQGNPYLGLVTGLAMVLNMMVATATGYLVPVLLKKMRIDPALASAVFVTTATDVLGFFFFLGLATLFLPKLL